MAVRFLRSMLSERIFTHVLEDARIMPHRLVKGLPPLASEGTKLAPLARHSAIGSTMPIKNLTFQSFKSAKMDAGNKESSRPGTEKISGVKGETDQLNVAF